MGGVKQCSKCRETLPRDAFSKNVQNPDGLAYYCRLCNAEKQREWKTAHPEEVRAAKSDYLKRQRRLRDRTKDHRHDTD